MGKKVTSRHSISSYALDGPEDGLFWHALSKKGLDLFNTQSPDFGTTSGETTHTVFENVKCVKCRPDKAGVAQWGDPEGAILVIPKADLVEGTDWIRVGSAGDAHVKAEAALDHGRLWQPTPSGKEPE